MLLGEMVRKFGDEQVLLNDAGPYSNGVAHDWTDRKTLNVTLTKEQILYVKWTGETTAANNEGNARVLLDDVPVMSTGVITDVETITREMWILLSAASYVLKFQTSLLNDTGSGVVQVKDLYVAQLNFSDQHGATASDSGSVSIDDEETKTIKTVSIVLPDARTLPVGSVNKFSCFVNVCMFEVDQRRSMVNDSGSTDLRQNWYLYVNDVLTAWTTKNDDFGTYSLNPTYAEGACGFHRLIGSPGETINIKIKCYNKVNATVNVRAIVSYFCCPWFIWTSEYEPIVLDFPQGSTIYVTLEPLDTNPTKTIKLGKSRFVSFGDATDYYSTDSGAGILTWDYTFEFVTVSDCLLKIAGFGGCVSYIGVDIR